MSKDRNDDPADKEPQNENSNVKKKSRQCSNPFLNFLTQLRRERGYYDVIALAKEGGRIWSHMSAAEKAPYIEMARKIRSANAACKKRRRRRRRSSSSRKRRCSRRRRRRSRSCRRRRKRSCRRRRKRSCRRRRKQSCRRRRKRSCRRRKRKMSCRRRQKRRSHCRMKHRKCMEYISARKRRNICRGRLLLQRRGLI